MAMHLSGVVFRRRWKPPRLKPWEGPFADPAQRLPQAPDVAARRRAARRRWRESQQRARGQLASPAADDFCQGELHDDHYHYRLRFASFRFAR